MQGRAIYKQVLPDSSPVQRFEWPAGSEVLHAGVKGGQVCIWFICNPAEPRRPRTFLLLPTGGPYDEGNGDDKGWSGTLGANNHVGTFTSEDGLIVGHLFAVGDISKQAEAQIEADLKIGGKVILGDGWG